MSETGRAARPRPYRGLSPTERHEQRHQRLLDAALEVFGTVGYRDATLNALCVAAGVSKRNFYDHFENSDALFIAVYDEIVGGAFASVSGALADPPDHDDVPAWLRRAIAAFIGYITEDLRRVRISFVEVVRASHSVESHRRKGIGNFTKLLIAASDELAELGWMPPWTTPQRRIAVSVVIGGVQESVTAWLATPADQRPSTDDLIDVLAEILVTVIRPR